MAGPLNFTVGRVRVTNVPSPSEGQYIRIIREQMNTVKGNMLKLIERIEGVTPEAIRFGLQPIFDESQRLVPVDTGKLKRSGFIEVRTQARGGRVSAEIGYGRFGQPFYAGFVHENLAFRHAPPTQALYLKAAVDKHVGDFVRRVGRFIQQQTGLKP
ncbi:hypothetical protein LCGC14_1569610 [marine sediment metagenome]|uniref:HK97 gp10 family phage protein n=1 Tax=marine sediment metagenome TaxID=412755 RepID=A0A0F9LKM0_9ZZZZ